MKKNHFLAYGILLCLLYSGCKPHHESLLDKIVSINDSIILNVPKPARLCDHMDVEKLKADIGDCKLYCEIEGEGIPLVLINGGPGDTHHYFHPWFSLAKDHFKIIYYDQRGCGQSDYIPGDGYTFDQAANDLENLRKALKIDKWIVLGFSFGGGLAQFYTIKYPEPVMGLVLIGTVPMMSNGIPPVSRTSEFMSNEEFKKLNELNQLFSSRKLDFAQMFYNQEINGGWKTSSFYKPYPERMAQRALYDMVKDSNFTTDYFSYNFENAFINCPIPTLVTEGRYDLSWNLEKQETIRRSFPNARFVWFENSGHCIYQDEPERFMKELENWAHVMPVANEQKIQQWKMYTRNLLDNQMTLITSNNSFIRMFRTGNLQGAIQLFDAQKKKDPNIKLFIEGSINQEGYNFLQKNKIDEAIQIFVLNVRAFPDSWNAYDSLGEAWLRKGDKKKAKENYLKSLELNPDNNNAKQVLTNL